ncbi:MAG TPA: class I SAM-dependent methyltransferase [Thermoleophilaceae bacterium]|nr:class I SAM-dependent methyltransferase [Thermoleophilaceae bacterium]
MAAPQGPPARIRVVGQALTGLVARFPAAWPLVRRPMRRFFDREAPDWDSVQRAGVRLAAFEAGLEALGEPPARVLDLGTGTGSAAEAMAARWPSARVTGVDISEQMIERARAKSLPDRVSFQVADASALPFPAAEFDLVTHNNVPVFFGEVARVLAPGGHVLVAASLGAATPFHTPSSVLRRGFARHGVDEEARGEAGPGVWWLGRRG